MAVPGLFIDTTVLMRRHCKPDEVGSYEVVRLHEDDRVLADCRSIGRQAQLDRCIRRRLAGLQFHSLRHGGLSIANTWTIRGGERFLDEAMLAFELGANDACLRDMYVHHDQRGRGVFAQFVRALEAGPLAGIARLWSCVERDNVASIAAHRRAGFEAVGEVSAIALFDRLLLRRSRIPRELNCREFRSSRRLLWLDARARAFRLAHLA